MANWAELVDTARWAPSPHNIQAWKLRVRSEREADLLYDPDRLLPDTDPTGRFTTAGFGIFVEMLRVAARAAGRDVAADWTHEPLDPGRSEPGLVARLTLHPAPGIEDVSPELVRRRRTSRVPYDGRPVDEAVLDELRALAAGFGHEFTASSDDDLVRWVLELNRDTLFYDLADERARREVGRWLRYSERSATARGDGFSPSALGFPGWLLFLFFRLPLLADAPGLRGVIRSRYFATMSGTRTVGWLQGPFTTPPECVEAGRLLARFWLTLEQHGLHLHPFGSIITNPRANARLRERIPASERGEPWLLVRMGSSPQPPRSHRLRTRELLVG